MLTVGAQRSRVWHQVHCWDVATPGPSSWSEMQSVCEHTCTRTQTYKCPCIYNTLLSIFISVKRHEFIPEPPISVYYQGSFQSLPFLIGSSLFQQCSPAASVPSTFTCVVSHGLLLLPLSFTDAFCPLHLTQPLIPLLWGHPLTWNSCPSF